MGSLVKNYPAKFSTHLAALIQLIPLVDKDIVELGTGIYSTPFLHWARYGREDCHVYSYENNPEYIDFAMQFNYANHHVELIDDWDSVFLEKPWSIALIDHAPSERRVIDIMRLADWADYIVVHDTRWKQEKHYGYKKVLSNFKYRKEYPTMTTWTTVVGNKDVKWPN